VTRKSRAKKAPKTRSGSNLSDARRAELGYGRLTLRLPLDALELLRVESERSGRSRAELIDAAVRQLFQRI
jgi:hypothetical protein